MLRRVAAPTALPSLMKGGAGRPVTECAQKAITKRDPRFSVVKGDDIATFQSIVGSKNVIEDPSTVQQYNQDWFKDYEGNGPVVLTPTTTEEVGAIVKHCAQRKLAVVPQGGNTGFVGGAVPVFDEVIVSVKKMNKVLEVDDLGATLRCQAGCILESLDEQLKKDNLMMPIDLGAKGSCHIGGNVSTAAGGVRFMRYGSMHANTLGLKVVLANGEILDTMSTLRKDNTGYDLKQLFIGAEGTLGIITEIGLSLAPLPKSVHTMFLGAANWDKLCQIYRSARRDLGEILSAVEMIDGQALDLVTGITKQAFPLDERCAYYMLLETNGSNADSDQAKLMSFLETATEQGVIQTGTLAESVAQSREIWALREGCATAPTAVGHVRWYDISMPSARMKDMIDLTRQAIEEKGFADKAKIIGFGHFGDGNLHINVVTMPSFDKAVVDAVDGFVYPYARSKGYSVSAEHGIGLQKRGYLDYSKSQPTIEWMKKVKGVFDPDGIMNPYKVFAPDTTSSA